ncbi:MAG: GTPase HflX [Succinivibrionaceae bacterium]|nr:GTPase HflX [Succinivibrionaceae bacterium]
MEVSKEQKSKAILVQTEITSELASVEDLSELRLLAVSADLDVVDVLHCRRAMPSPRFFIGSGKIEELAVLVEQNKADLVIFNNPLTPAQERNISKEIKCTVLERTSLILHIFAQRARTYEGKLQVELARLKYQATRLVRGWTHLERQKGGFGLRGGPGEKQLELDRRMLNERIDEIERVLSKVESQREQSRKARRKNEVPVLSLVGYTNAGKSSLFNYLTKSDVYAADQLFATLDPTLRTLELENIGRVIFADTVGFIRHLPHDLVAAFKATLQETREATILLHVVDCHDERMQDNIEQVNLVLNEIGAGNVKQLLVFNKIDLMDCVSPHVVRDENGVPKAVWMSAKTGEGSDLLCEIINELLQKNIVKLSLVLPSDSWELRSALYERKAIVSEKFDGDGNDLLEIEISEVEFNRLSKKYKSLRSYIG